MKRAPPPKNGSDAAYAAVGAGQLCFKRLREYIGGLARCFGSVYIDIHGHPLHTIQPDELVG